MGDPTGHNGELVSRLRDASQIFPPLFIACLAIAAIDIISKIHLDLRYTPDVNDYVSHSAPWLKEHVEKTTAAAKKAYAVRKAVEITAAAIASGAAIAQEIDKRKYNSPYAYRAMSKDDYDNYMSGRGFEAIHPGGNTTMEQHIAEGGNDVIKGNSPYISASRQWSGAKYYYDRGKATGDDYGIATIDLRQVMYVPAYAMNFSNPMANLFAGRDQEILIWGSVPKSAIVKVDYLKKME